MGRRWFDSNLEDHILMEVYVMGIINYLVNPQKQAIFVLGKMYPGYDLQQYTKPSDMKDACIRWGLLSGHTMESATRLAESVVIAIQHTIGLDDNIGMSDNDDVLLQPPYADFVIVGSFYRNDHDVGKTYKNTVLCA